MKEALRNYVLINFAILLLTFKINAWFKSTGKKHSANKILTIGFIILFITISSPLFFEYEKSCSSPILIKNGNITETPIGVFDWEFKKNYYMLPTINTEVETSISFRLACGNDKTSKVLVLKYFLEVKIQKPTLFFHSELKGVPSGSHGVWNTESVNKEICIHSQIAEIVLKELQKFNAKFSDTSFLNRQFEKNGQEEFKSLLIKHIGDSLSENGLRIVSVKFSVI